MNLSEARRHPLVEYARTNLWGSGATDIPEQFENEFNALSPEDQQIVRVLFTAATISCPIPLSLAKDPKYGPAYLEKRYSSVGFWYRYLKKGPLKDTSFGSPVDLTHFGGRGWKFDKKWISADKKYSLIGPSTYEGHVLPRLIIDFINYYSQQSEFDVATMTFQALDTISDQASNPIEAIASLAEYMKGLGFDVKRIKERLFDEGYQKENPEGYWRPIFGYLNDILPTALNFE